MNVAIKQFFVPEQYCYCSGSIAFDDLGKQEYHQNG
jgi:hypothetical protein